ncbi:MAG: quinolinate synthase NadA [Rickettsiales bacterium]|nr:quinolinate synthase NadA [Rickettsiales bacterium]
MQEETLIPKIKNLLKTKNAILLAHYYQNDDIQDIADFVGDSLDLSKKAATTDADIILFSGVKFMADVAKILNPNKKVLVPDLNAGCSLEESCPPDKFKEFCQLHSDHLVISYINCSAEVKALSDIIVTSSNAEAIINSLDKNEKIIFAPDKNLGNYLNKKTGRNMKLWQGSCIVHEQFSLKKLIQLKERFPDANVIAHPECPEYLLDESDFIGSTSKLLNYVKESSNNNIIVLTESGIIHQMNKINPKINYHIVPAINDTTCTNCSNCPFMKMNDIEKIYNTILNENNEIILPSELRDKAQKPLQKMLKII